MEKETKLQVGDTVILKSGSPRMRVVDPAVLVVSVEFLSSDGEKQYDYFPLGCLCREGACLAVSSCD